MVSSFNVTYNSHISKKLNINKVMLGLKQYCMCFLVMQYVIAGFCLFYCEAM